MNNMTITNAKYNLQHDENCSVTATIEGKVFSVPLDPANRHYAEIMRQVEAGELTIADAD
tara:strand:+ start:336 stop:515 length:180 start_codon:yes stop_codon:yes gene_type:complete